jgi:hypothetical protein
MSDVDPPGPAAEPRAQAGRRAPSRAGEGPPSKRISTPRQSRSARCRRHWSEQISKSPPCRTKHRNSQDSRLIQSKIPGRFP